MKKKILILIMCVCMIVPLFAFASFADVPPVYSSDYAHISFETGQRITSSSNIVVTSDSMMVYYNSTPFIYEPRAITYGFTNNVGMTIFGVDETLPDYIYLKFPFSDNIVGEGFCDDNRSYLYNQVFNGTFDLYFPLSGNDSLTSDKIELLRSSGILVEVIEVSEPSNVLDLMFKGVTATSVGLANGIKESVSNLVYDYTPDGERVLSDFVIFVFVIAGLAIAMTVFWLVFRLIRFGRQR